MTNLQLAIIAWAIVWLGIGLMIGFHMGLTRRPKLRERFAHCKCGQRMSEWFITEGVMWHPEFAHGCGWISPWADHADYREQTAIHS